MDKKIKRKPGVILVTGENEIKSHSISGCIGFTIQNAGDEVIYFGFERGREPDVPIEPGENTSWELYNECEEWDGEVFIKFGETGSTVFIMQKV